MQGLEANNAYCISVGFSQHYTVQALSIDDAIMLVSMVLAVKDVAFPQ